MTIVDADMFDYGDNNKLGLLHDNNIDYFESAEDNVGGHVMQTDEGLFYFPKQLFKDTFHPPLSRSGLMWANFLKAYQGQTVQHERSINLDEEHLIESKTINSTIENIYNSTGDTLENIEDKANGTVSPLPIPLSQSQFMIDPAHGKGILMMSLADNIHKSKDNMEAENGDDKFDFKPIPIPLQHPANMKNFLTGKMAPIRLPPGVLRQHLDHVIPVMKPYPHEVQGLAVPDPKVKDIPGQLSPAEILELNPGLALPNNERFLRPDDIMNRKKFAVPMTSSGLIVQDRPHVLANKRLLSIEKPSHISQQAWTDLHSPNLNLKDLQVIQRIRKLNKLREISRRQKEVSKMPLMKIRTLQALLKKERDIKRKRVKNEYPMTLWNIK